MLSDTMMLGGGRKAAYSMENSLLFRGAQYLGRTPGAVGDRNRWTLSLHVRRAALGSYQYIYSAGPNPTTNEDFIGFDTSDRLNVRINGVTRLVSARGFRDPTAWGHLVVAFDAANPEPSLKLRVYWNGAEITGWSTDSRAAILPGAAQTNTLNPHRLGHNVADNSGYFSGYLAEACLVDGAALGPSHFAEFDAVTGNWAPKRVTLNTQLPTYRGNLVPRMTGYEAPSGKVQASNDGSSPAWRAFNQSSDPTDGWQTTSGVGWISYAPAVPVIVSAYSIRVTSTDPANRSPKSWTFEGYNGSAWVVLDTQSDVPAWNGQEKRLYTFSNGTAYSSYRLNINALQGGATIVSIKTIEFFSSVETSPYGPNGFHLGKPWNSTSLGADSSGLGNDWMPNGFAASDVVADSPTNVYPTWNPLDNVVALTDGALKATGISGTAFNVRAGLWFDVAAPTGWYWEFASVGGRVVEGAIGIAPQDYAINNTASSGAAGLMSNVAVYAPNGSKYGRGADVAYGSDWPTGAIVAVAVKSGKVWFGLVSGGVVAWQGGGDPVAGGNPAYSGLTGYWAPFMYSATSGVGGTINFGQRAFSGACPAGFKALCTANMPATSGVVSGAFTGNASADGPCVYTGAVPQTLTINGNAVIWGTHADRLATGFKIRTAAGGYNSGGSNTWVATYDRKPIAAGKGRAPANAQAN